MVTGLFVLELLELVPPLSLCLVSVLGWLLGKFTGPSRRCGALEDLAAVGRGWTVAGPVPFTGPEGLST